MKKLILILTFCISCAQTDETIITPTEINYTIEKIHETDYVPWSIEFIDKNTFLYTERRGKMFKVYNGESIEIKNVSFKYSNNSESVFDNLNFKIKRNDFIGLIGKSGSGKSTIINLLLGFLKPQKGEVIYEYNKNSDSYSSVFGYIPQDHFLINDTLISNVALSQNKDDINIHNIKIL